MYVHSHVLSEGIEDACMLSKIGTPFIVGLKLEGKLLKLCTQPYIHFNTKGKNASLQQKIVAEKQQLALLAKHWTERDLDNWNSTFILVFEQGNKNEKILLKI